MCSFVQSREREEGAGERVGCGRRTALSEGLWAKRGGGGGWRVEIVRTRERPQGGLIEAGLGSDGQWASWIDAQKEGRKEDQELRKALGGRKGGKCERRKGSGRTERCHRL